jgi:hypothetical protein
LRRLRRGRGVAAQYGHHEYAERWPYTGPDH